MNVIIAGAGEVGGYAAEVFSRAGHNVTVIDVAPEKLRGLDDRLDLRTLQGHCAHHDVLIEAGIEHCDLMIAATQVDEINLLTASLAKAAGAKKTYVRVHHAANYALRNSPLKAKLGIDELICPEHLTAQAVSRRLRNPGAIAIEEFGRDQVTIERIVVEPKTPAVGQTLVDIRLPPNVRIATVERNGAAFVADAQTEIHENDAVTLFGETKRFEAARKLFRKGKAKHRSVVVMGEASVAVWLVRAMSSRLFSVRMFVQSHSRAEELSAKLPHATVIEADPTDSDTFAEEHLEKSDVFIAATEDDEHNILACARAKQLGVATVVTVVQRSKYLHLLSHVGIDHSFSPRAEAVQAMWRLFNDEPIRSLAVIAEETAELYEIRPAAHSLVLGHDLRNVTLPDRAMVAAIQRGEKVFVPGAEDRIEAGDLVLVIGPRGLEPVLHSMFVKK